MTAPEKAPACACGHDFDAHGVRSDGGEYCAECRADCVPAPPPPAEGEAGKVLTREEYELAVRGEYDQPGQLVRGVKDLLAHDAALRERVAGLIMEHDRDCRLIVAACARADALQEEVNRLKKESGR